ncbi:hypothetical protein [Martelella endophytica]|uniref:Uncharacterized protein n=1 Tax=Martelella endophytica TaxID=1486262 RepID=A0A0D5LUZ6_MAREN|nr:hypothetical protein [Martelella endophytica]AJY47198.1 hypothetical protein TM49_18385 [Martelella endophytica]
MTAESSSLIERYAAAIPRLADDQLAAAVLALATAGEAADSRAAALKLGVGHALVLRAIATLATPPALIGIDRRDHRTQRIFFHVLPAARNSLAMADNSKQQKGKNAPTV